MKNLMGKPIGETLKEGRQRQHLSISECAKRTRISAHYLEALEEERWERLPSESHRIGFLRLYATFLGVYSDEMTQNYRQATTPPPDTQSLPELPRVAPKRSPERSLNPGTMTWQRLSLVLILALVSLWGFYHGLRRYWPDRHVDLSWLRFKHESPRLVTAKREIPVQRVRAKAEADSWLRVMDRNQLVFEGILPAGAVKEWSGPGPFKIKVANINAVSIYWNEQSVDIKALAHGHVADVKLPPDADKR
jgi:transcriptional regulator with XRE-family HTH domain